MKTKIVNSILFIALSFAFYSCEKTDGAQYSGESNKISFFSTATSLNMTGGFMEVPVGRTSTEGEISLPVTLTASGAGYTNVFEVAGPITFANGQAKSYAKINYGDFSNIDPSSLSVTSAGLDVNVGLAFPITLKIDDADISASNVQSINIQAANALVFGSSSSTELNSTEGWSGAISDINIQKAEGANVYKIVSPFGANSFAFMIKSDGKTIVCPNQVIDNHPSYGPVSMTGVTGTLIEGIVTLNVTAYTVSAGSFGGGTEIITLP